VSSDRGVTPIMMTLMNGKLEATNELFKRGADLSKITNTGLNLLHLATLGGFLEAVDWVLEKSTLDVNSASEAGISQRGWYHSLHHRVSRE
jgi:ankyrin repeat protein